MAKVSLNDFPKLEINRENVYESWRSWLVQFNLAIEIAIMNMGTELVRIEGGEDEVLNVFRGRRKLVALISAIGDAGRTVLDSVGFMKELCKFWLNIMVLRTIFLLRLLK